jgi:Flp pilus assembly protein TadG
MSPLTRRFASNDSGLSALEFALIAPIMITIYFGAYEMCDVLLVDRKVTNVAAATTDLVAQALQVANSDITDIFTASSAIMVPYNLTNLTVIVTSVVADAQGVTKVGWSDAYHGTAHAVGSTFSVPVGLVQAGGSVIVSEVTYAYATPFGMFVTSGINMSDKFYERPRRLNQIPRV